jgi:hypothetical protein
LSIELPLERVREAQVRRWLAVVTCAVALAALAACSAPTGIDGDLTNGWDVPPRPQQFRPLNGRCFDHVEETSPMREYAPIACTERHLTETYYVGDLTGASAAAGAADPVTGSAAQRAAGLRCARQASAFAGGDWRTGQLTIRPVLPGPEGWAAGARWFRCDILQISLGGHQVTGRSGSLAGALRGAAALRLRCFDPTVTAERVSAMRVVSCERAHHAEFAGLWAPPNPTQALLDDDTKAAPGCRSAIAAYTGIPDDSDLPYRVGWIGFSPTPDDWNAGVRDVRCFLWLDDVAMTGSYRGAGTRKLPVAYE